MKILYRWLGDTLQVAGGYFTGGWGPHRWNFGTYVLSMLIEGAGAVLKTSAAPGKEEGR